MALFNVELRIQVENINDLTKADKQKQTPSVGKAPERSNDSTLADMASPELAAILGLCSDMCPGDYLSSSYTFFAMLFWSFYTL